MAEEAAVEPEFRFLPAKAVTAEAAAGCGLVVLDRVSGIADLGLPVLALG